MKDKCNIKVAGHIIEVNYLFAGFKEYVKDYICSDLSKPEFSLTITQNLIDEERKKDMTNAKYENRPAIEYEDDMYEISCVCRLVSDYLISKDILLMHGGALVMDSKAVIFTAKSGTGKTTHACMWQQSFGDKVQIINGDKPFLEINEDAVEVYGSPWSGKERANKNISAPLKAICVIERSEVNEVYPISFEEVFPMLVQQTYRGNNPQLVARALERIGMLENRVKFYKIKCLPNVEAAQLAKSVIFGE